MDKVTYINPSSGEAAAARAIMNVLMPMPHPYDGPFLRRDLENVAKVGQYFDGTVERLLKAHYINELRVVTYELILGKDTREPMPDGLTEPQLDIMHALRIPGNACMWCDIYDAFDSSLPYSDMLKLVSRGIVKSYMNFAYEINPNVLE